jgi:hypothetical protein
MPYTNAAYYLAKPLGIIGVELGARMERTALSVIEHRYVRTGEYEQKAVYHPQRYAPAYKDLQAYEKLATEYHVRHLERHGPPVFYKHVAKRVVELTQEVVASHGDGRDATCCVVIDITRMGRPAHTLILQAIRGASSAYANERAQIRTCSVTISGREGGATESEDVGYTVPRRDLVSQAVLLFEDDRLKIAQDLPLTRTLIEEFENFKPKEDPDEDLMGWRLAENDDLVLSVAISLWAAGRFLHNVDSIPA